MKQFYQSGLLILLFLGFSVSLIAQNEKQETNISSKQVADQVYMLKGRGGNMGVLFGDHRALLIDDQFAPLTEKIRTTIHEIKDVTVSFVLNTHWHPDHTGGNKNFGKTGSHIIAHENVRIRLKNGQKENYFGRTIAPASYQALPIMTYTRDITFHFSRETTSVMHIPHAHTDGDSIVHFEDKNVIHAGDIFFNGTFPFIDLSAGGNISGIMKGVNELLDRSDDKTKIIPGHGPLGTRSDLKEYRRMLDTIRTRIARQIDNGNSLKETQKSNPTRGYAEEWGTGFINPDQFTEMVYRSIKEQ